MEHSRYFSPSSISRRILCHGSAFLEAQIPDTAAGLPARYGTLVHHIAEHLCKSNIDPIVFEGMELDGAVVDKAAIAMARQYKLDIDFLRKDFKTAKKDTLYEERLQLEGTDVFGTSDFTGFNRSYVLIADLKTGQTHVSPHDNPQLMTYAMMKQRTLRNRAFNVIMAISQPSTPGTSLSYSEIHANDLEKWVNDVFNPMYEAITAGDTDCTPGEKQCQWCKAKATCEAYADHCLDISQTAFLVPEIVIDDEMVNRVYPNIKMLKSFIGEIEKRAYAMAPEGALSGYKLVKGHKKRTWKDEAMAIEAIKLTGHEPTVAKVLTPAQAEKLDKNLKKNIQELIDVGYQKDCIVKESDKRQAITNTADMFGVIEE